MIMLASDGRMYVCTYLPILNLLAYYGRLVRRVSDCHRSCPKCIINREAYAQFDAVREPIEILQFDVKRLGTPSIIVIQIDMCIGMRLPRLRECIEYMTLF